MSYCQNKICYNLARRYPYTSKIKGGGKKYVIEYRKNFKLEFTETFDDNNEKIILLSNNLEKVTTKDNSCLVIELNKSKTAHIFGVSSSSLYNCFADPEFILKKPGNFYLDMSIKMLRKYKEKLNINKITLLDNAQVQPKMGKSYSLSQFKLLTEGNTWYEKYGFKINKESKKQHRMNKDIIKNLRTKETNLYKLIKNTNHEKTKEELDYKNSILKYLGLNQNDYLQESMKMIFVKNRHNYSDLLYSLIIEKLLRNIEKNYDSYERFKQNTFYLKI